MQNKHTIRDRCILFTLLFIFSIGTYSLFGNIKSVNFYDLAGYQHRVKGTVTDSNGVPIAGATVTIKGSSTGTFTNEEGVFFVNASPPDVLIITYMGFKPLEVQVGSSEDLSLVLEEDVTNLDAVTVNAGYYTVKERERTGSIAKVTSEEIELQPIVSPLEALQGRMAGVEVEQGSGVTGLAPTIRIRGQNSMRNSRTNNGNFPLYIIDGTPISSVPIRSPGAITVGPGIDPLGTLNLNNIESIEVLKDADATAIYGSRGANGVVLITTKRGKFYQDKTSLEINLYSGISEVSNKVELLTTKQYLSMRRQAIENDGVLPENVYAPDLTLWSQEGSTDWQDVLFGKSAFTSNINVAIAGGNDHTTYRIGGSYLNQGSVFPGDFNYDKLTANINLNHHSKNNKFKLNFSANYGIDINKMFNGTNLVYNALFMPPNSPPIYQEDGSLNWDKWVIDNPLSILEEPQEIKINNLLANMSISYSIFSNFQLKVNLGYSKLDNEDQIKYYKERYNPSIRDRLQLRVVQNSSNRRSWIIEPQIMFHNNYDKINIEALVGSTFQDNENNYQNVTGSGYADKSLMGNLSAAETIRFIDDDKTDYRYAAIFGRLGINWSKKYFLNVTGRRDGSSRFGPNRRFSNFWAFGGAWIFSKEEFIKDNLPFLNFGKLRGSYGTTGSDQIPDYGYLDAYEATDNPGGLYPTQLVNPDYSWEINRKLEFALQLGFIKNKINTEVSWYRNRSSNQLVGFPLPATTGFTSVQANLPALVQNKGWEFLLNSLNLNNRNFTWQTSLNMTFPDNELVEFDNIDKTSYDNIYRVGHPLNIRLLYEFDGIDPNTGQYQVKDINGDGSFDSRDMMAIRDMGRKYYGGVNNTFQFKGVSFSFLLEYVKQNNGSYIFSTSAPGSFGIKHIEFLDSWEKPGDNENIQKLSQSFVSSTAFRLAASSTKAITDASFLRLKNISLSYSLPQTILEKLNMTSGRIYIQAQNLFTITPYKGLDPQGGQLVVPPLRTITCGIKLTL